MKVAVATLKSSAPYSSSRYHEVEANPKESPKDYDERTWKHRVHTTDDGHILIPGLAFKNCLSEAAKYLSKPVKGKSTYTKHFEAGLMILEPLILPDLAADVRSEVLFVPSSGRRGDGSRVRKRFPLIPEWRGQVTIYVLDPIITREVLMEHLVEAGKFIGIGRFRPRNNGFYGRFKVENLTWEDETSD